MSSENTETKVRRRLGRILDEVQVSGTVRIIDKDGNLKSEMKITGLELQDEDKDDATE